MKVLVIGGGGREHAMAWKLSESPKVTKVYVAPGNGGTALNSKLENVAITDVRELRVWAQAEKIALTVVGPEGPAGGRWGRGVPCQCPAHLRPHQGCCPARNPQALFQGLWHGTHRP